MGLGYPDVSRTVDGVDPNDEGEELEEILERPTEEETESYDGLGGGMVTRRDDSDWRMDMFFG